MRQSHLLAGLDTAASPGVPEFDPDLGLPVYLHKQVRSCAGEFQGLPCQFHSAACSLEPAHQPQIASEGRSWGPCFCGVTLTELAQHLG